MKKDNTKEQLWALFNRKWTRDVGTEGYDKEEWKKLESLILYFMKEEHGNPEVCTVIYK